MPTVRSGERQDMLGCATMAIVTGPIQTTEYCFIDGGYVRKCYSEAMCGLFKTEGELDILRLKLYSKRVFYYDCIPEGTTIEPQEPHAKQVEAERIRNTVAEAPGFHLRLGDLILGKKKIRQKKVDALLAVDMLTNGFYKNMDTARLYAGDRDFQPIVESLVRNGTWVEVWYVPGSASEELYRTADVGRALSLNEIYQWSSANFQASHAMPKSFGNCPIPTESEGIRFLTSGDWRDGAVKIFQRRQGGNWICSLFYHPNVGQQPTEIQFGDLDGLKYYFEKSSGAVKWKLP